MPQRIEYSVEEELQMLRDTIVALLKQDPHHPFAQVLGQRFMDLAEEL